MHDRLPEQLEVRQYEPTEAFHTIAQHTAVARPDGQLIAVTGPAGDATSERYAQLFALAPQMLALLDTIQAWFTTTEADQLASEPSWYDDLAILTGKAHLKDDTAAAWGAAGWINET